MEHKWNIYTQIHKLYPTSIPIIPPKPIPTAYRSLLSRQPQTRLTDSQPI